MKKTFLIILIVLMALCIIALAFRVYSVVSGEKAEAALPSAAVPTASPSDAVAQPDAASADTAAEAETLKALMADFGDKIQAGSAGSSLKAAGQAVRLINWGIGTKMTDEEISAVVSGYIAGMDGAERATYLAQIELLDSTYKQLLTAGQEEFLESAGCADSGYPWGSEPIGAVEAFFEATGVRSLSE